MQKVVIDLVSEEEDDCTVRGARLPSAPSSPSAPTSTTASMTTETEEEGPAVLVKSQKQQGDDTRLKMMLSYAKTTGHYQAAENWYRLLEEKAQSFTAQKVPVNLKGPEFYDDTECQGCHDLPRPMLRSAFDDANDDLSSLPKIWQVYLVPAPPFPPTYPAPTNHTVFSLCYTRDNEGPHRYARLIVLCYID